MKKRVLSVVASFMLLAAIALPALAKDWVQIGDRHYIDADSIKQASDYGTYTYTTKYMAKDFPLEEINGRKVWTIKTNSYMDCKSAYAKTISYTAYDADDKVIVTNNYVHKQWININSGSRASDSYEFICSDKYLNKRPYYNSLWLY